MNKPGLKENQERKPKIISSLLQDLLNWSSKECIKVVDLKTTNSLQLKEHDPSFCLDLGKHLSRKHLLVT